MIAPVLEALRAAGHDVDRAAARRHAVQSGRLREADAVLAMYHDQGLPVLKHASFGSGVNVTLGLPIVRTSVDHGTALDLAGTGRAEVGKPRSRRSSSPPSSRASRDVARSRRDAHRAAQALQPELPRSTRRVIADIVAAVAPRAGDRVVEIGPGLGALTRPLARARAARCTSSRSTATSSRGCATNFRPERLVIHEGDALEFDFARSGTSLRVVGNLPYHISTPLLFHLARARDAIARHPRHAAERSGGAHGGGARRLRIRAALGHAAVPLRDGKNARRPAPTRSGRAPKVESAVVRMIPRAPDAPRARDERLFARTVAAGVFAAPQDTAQHARRRAHARGFRSARNRPAGARADAVGRRFRAHRRLPRGGFDAPDVVRIARLPTERAPSEPKEGR